MSKILTLFFLFFSIFLYSPFVYGEDIHIISREAWGANEEYRYLDSTEWKGIIKQRILDKKKREEEIANLSIEERIEYGTNSAISYDLSELRNKYLLENFSEDISLAQTVREHNGRVLAWPQKYTNYVNSIVIHHTEGQYEDSYDAMRAIYKYHAVNREWGDVGYNYLIGLDGEIFEGRAGGDYVVGAHNRWNNRSTVGVALIGSYQNHEPSENQLQSLEKLVLYLSKKYGIDMGNTIPIHNVCKSDGCGTKGALYTQYYSPITGHRDGGHTSCPGDHLYNKIDTIRENISESTFGLQRVKNPVLEIAKVDIKAKIKKINTENNIKNKIKQINAYNAALKKFNALPWDKVKKSITKISEGRLLNVYVRVQILNQRDNETYKALVIAELEEIIANRLYALNSNVDDNLIGGDEAAIIAFDDLNTIKIKLSYPHLDTISIKSSSEYRGEISQIGSSFEIPFLKNIDTDTSFAQLNFNYYDQRLNVNDRAKISMKNGKKIRIKSPDDGYLEISSWERIPGWDTSGDLNDNTFRGDIILSIEDGKLLVVNEVTLSDYLKGLGEVDDFEKIEKIKTITVTARTYARWYTTQERKFEGTWYDGTDNADTFQSYLGYGLEQRSPNISELVNETKDQVITYNGNLIKPWYHSSSNGRTISFEKYCSDCEDKNDYPYLASVLDYSPDATQTIGHGVGIPGTGVKDLANRGWNYAMIIKYFLPGTQIEKISNPQ